MAEEEDVEYHDDWEDDDGEGEPAGDCVRCGRLYPRDAQGWALHEPELEEAGWWLHAGGPLCPGCVTPADRDALAVYFATQVLTGVAKKRAAGELLDEEILALVAKAAEGLEETAASMRSYTS